MQREKEEKEKKEAEEAKLEETKTEEKYHDQAENAKDGIHSKIPFGDAPSIEVTFRLKCYSSCPPLVSLFILGFPINFLLPKKKKKKTILVHIFDYFHTLPFI